MTTLACMNVRSRVPLQPRVPARHPVTLAASALLGMVATGFSAIAATGDTELISVGLKSGNASAVTSVGRPAVSANGRYVLYGWHLFPSAIYLRDRVNGVTEVIDVPYAGGVSDGGSRAEALTPDARYATFSSGASNLVPGPTNGAGHVYLRDRQAGTTERISVSSSGEEGNDSSFGSAITRNGRFVAFVSFATNLAPGAANAPPIFVRDRLNHTTVRIGSTAPFTVSYPDRLSISDDGRYIVFEADGPEPLPEINVFLYDRQLRNAERISIAASGDPFEPTSASSSPSMSPDGRYVAFDSVGNNLGPVDVHEGSDIYVRDRQTGVVTRESYGIGPWVRGLAFNPSISAEGRFVAFESISWNLVRNDTNDLSDVFVRDRKTGAIERVSVASDGTQAEGIQINSGSYDASISRDGRWVVFQSRANNLVPNDFNRRLDAYIHDCGPRAP